MILENCSGLKNGIIFTKKHSFRTFRNSLEIFFFCIKKFLKWNFFGSSRLLFTISLCAYFFAFFVAIFIIYHIIYSCYHTDGNSHVFYSQIFRSRKKFWTTYALVLFLPTFQKVLKNCPYHFNEILHSHYAPKGAPACTKASKLYDWNVRNSQN